MTLFKMADEMSCNLVVFRLLLSLFAAFPQFISYNWYKYNNALTEKNIDVMKR